MKSLFVFLSIISTVFATVDLVHAQPTEQTNDESVKQEIEQTVQPQLCRRGC
jgi:hypothetical protein